MIDGLSGSPSDFLLFVTDENGLMVAASVPDAVFDSNGNQVRASHSPEAKIAMLSTLLE
eukprot:CAMPEP_0171775442 /NCGR_PEP_ID=MMETSP0991-20121206/56504_1 /TAXON_ID=483369 /ORGANISM="non described non described, Strain CCMP2098" /LENGTH=58 /DNA_ID=CAMNT_0012381597 /DNA_START=33 /DNA_END=206 /DNA_ORIENTATION=+